MDLPSRWVETWRRLAEVPEKGLYEKLVAAYGEPHRHYHTLQHLEECFAQLDLLSSSVNRPQEIELALWFHDAVYDTHRKDSEERSAQWARQVLPPGTGERVHALVLATKHQAVPEGIDARVLVDVDLSILGAPEPRFDEYEAQVRKEYSWVLLPAYRIGRRKVLEGFLARPWIFQTGKFRDTHEERARANLARSLARL